MTFVIQILIAILLSIAVSTAFSIVVGRVVATCQSKRLKSTPAKEEPLKVVGKLEWTPEDVEALRVFNNTPTGAKLIQNSQALIAATCVRSCGEVMHTAHSAGVGHGMNEFFRWYQSLASNEMLSLSAPAPLTQNNTDNLDGLEALSDKYRP